MPETLHLRAERPGDLERAAKILRGGGLVAFPTETVYGLGANALSPEAVSGIFAAKARPAWDPLIVHVAEVRQLAAMVSLTGELAERVRLLTEAFWPGPMTLLLPRTSIIPDAVTAGREKAGVRIPGHPVARALLAAVGLPIAAPSANRFGHISPTTAEHVLNDLGGRIDAVLDGGPCRVGLESTVLDPAPTPMLIYRAGAVTAESLRARTGLPVAFFVPGERTTAEPQSLPSPGVGIRHYAPEAKLVLAGPSAAALRDVVNGVLATGQENLGVLLPFGWELERESTAIVQPWGAWENDASLAAGLFAGLRALETRGVRVIVCPLPEPGELREALRDRLLKAARPREGLLTS